MTPSVNRWLRDHQWLAIWLGLCALLLIIALMLGMPK